MDPLKQDLQGVLQYHEVLWSKILEIKNIDHVEIARVGIDLSLFP
jgi:hypothetical protein